MENIQYRALGSVPRSDIVLLIRTARPMNSHKYVFPEPLGGCRPKWEWEEQRYRCDAFCVREAGETGKT